MNNRSAIRPPSHAALRHRPSGNPRLRSKACEIILSASRLIARPYRAKHGCEHVECRRRPERAVPRKLGKVGLNVVEQLERSKSNDLARLIYALGIRHVGEKAAATLARHFRTMDRIVNAPAEALQSVSEIGPVVAASVRIFADQPSNRALVARLEDAGVNMKSQAPDVTSGPGPLSGTTWVLTGTLSAMTREQAQEALEQLGARVSSAISKKTRYLVAGALAGAKLEKARQLGIETLDEEAFLALIMEKRR